MSAVVGGLFLTRIRHTHPSQYAGTAGRPLPIIRAITNIFATIPNLITDNSVTAMLEHQALPENDLVKMVTDEARSPITVKETHEYLEEEWESTDWVLSSRKR